MRKTKDDANLRKILAEPLSLAFRVRHQRQNERRRKIYPLHAPEIERIGKSLPSGLTRGARRTDLTSSASRCRSRPRSNRSKRGQFIAHAAGKPL